MESAALLSVLVLVPQLVGGLPGVPPVDCSDIYDQDNSRPSGVYTVYPIEDTYGVQVFQRRMDGSLNFYRPWDYYRTGFGSADGEIWLGLENLFQLCLRKKYELLVDMEDFEGNKAYARYSSFSIGPEDEGYKLEVTGFTDGGAGDSLSYHSGMKFTTFDKDQDIDTHCNCARCRLGAFWYHGCHYTNPNGLYSWGRDGVKSLFGIEWQQWKGHNYSLKRISFKIRPVK
uniref:Fibrinogen C-terminal domain-containing protein n=1 Tax=Oryzias latipes TaxID=8090 RepID=A0A3P9J0Y4_ORYLA